MECIHCNKILSTKSSLNKHQKTAKYCLKIQGENIILYTCDICDNTYSTKGNLNKHTCKGVKTFEEKYIELEKKYTESQIENKILIQENKILKEDKKDLQKRYDKLSLKAISRPTTTTNSRTVQINQYIQNMDPISDQDLEDCCEHLTLEYHRKGVEGYAEFAADIPFKNKLACTDTARLKYMYKIVNGEIIADVGLRKLFVKFAKAIKDKSFKLCQQHYEVLSEKYTEKQLAQYDFNKAAISLAMYANGMENPFCTKLINLLSKRTKV